MARTDSKRIDAFLALSLAVFTLGSGCRREETAVAPAVGTETPPPQAARLDPASPAGTDAPKIVINLVGVVSLFNPDPTSSTEVHALIPRKRGKQTASDMSVIPAHRAFVRFRMGQGFHPNSPRQPDKRFTFEGKEYGVVFLDGEQVSVLETAPNAPGTSLYYRYKIANPPEIPQTDEEKTAFHWVPKMSDICSIPKEDYPAPNDAKVEKLVAIDRGLLKSIPPTEIWRFEPEREGGQPYTTAAAEGVRWELEPQSPQSTTYSIRTNRNPASLIFDVNNVAIELGDYPMEEILMEKPAHDPESGYVDRHFELYYKFFKAHTGGYHVPRLIKRFGESTIVTRVGPSCAPVSMP